MNKHDFEKSEQDMEIKHAQHVISLLKQWNAADDNKRIKILRNPTCERLLGQYDYPIKDLIWRLNKAIDVYEYKPSDKSIFDFAMERDFPFMPIYAPKRDVEIERAMDCLDLLGEYMRAKTNDEKNAVLVELDKYDRRYSMAIKEYKFDPLCLLEWTFRAILLNRFRPKNMEFGSFVFSNDLDYISGEFDTFDLKLSQDLKNGVAHEKIRDQFGSATTNRSILAEQFANDWILRLGKHPKLVAAAKSAAPNERIAAYTKLFTALANDFCDDYHIPRSVIVVKATNDESKFSETGYGRHVGMHYIPKSFRHMVKKSDLKNSAKSPFAQKLSYIFVSPDRIAKRASPNNLFNAIIGVFVHEMNHALDYSMSRFGALGPQVNIADDKIYTSTNEQEYIKSATERSSNKIEDVLFYKLRAMDKVQNS